MIFAAAAFVLWVPHLAMLPALGRRLISQSLLRDSEKIDGEDESSQGACG
jgi:hypothetical protein